MDEYSVASNVESRGKKPRKEKSLGKRIVSVILALLIATPILLFIIFLNQGFGLLDRPYISYYHSDVYTDGNIFFYGKDRGRYHKVEAYSDESTAEYKASTLKSLDPEYVEIGRNNSIKVKNGAVGEFRIQTTNARGQVGIIEVCSEPGFADWRHHETLIEKIIHMDGEDWFNVIGTILVILFVIGLFSVPVVWII